MDANSQKAMHFISSIKQCRELALTARDMECWYALWSIVYCSPPYLVSGQWDNRNIEIITLRLHFVFAVTLYLL